jgi:hypothetical protein
VNEQKKAKYGPSPSRSRVLENWNRAKNSYYSVVILGYVIRLVYAINMLIMSSMDNCTRVFHKNTLLRIMSRTILY